MSFCETQPWLKKLPQNVQDNNPLQCSPHDMLAHTKRKDLEKDAEAFLHLAQTLSYTLIKGRFRLEFNILQQSGSTVGHNLGYPAATIN